MTELKNKQHYVFQAYLKNWYNDKKQVCVFKKSERKIFNTTTVNILHEHQMYKIQELNNDEKEFLELLMTVMHLNNADKSEMREHIKAYLLPYANQDIVEALKTINPIPDGHPLNIEIQQEFKKLDGLIKEQMVNSEEDFLSDYETDGKKWIDMLIAGDMGFYYSENQTVSGIELPSERADFLNFICIQYFRTAGMRRQITDNIQNMVSLSKEYRNKNDGEAEIKFNPANVDPEHILPHFVWIIQTKCSAGLAKADIQIIRNKTSLPFITSDQPVINMKAEVGKKAPNEFVLWYPLSPEVGVIINGSKGEKSIDKKSEIDRLNNMIWQHSFEYIVGNNEELLRGMSDMVW